VAAVEHELLRKIAKQSQLVDRELKRLIRRGVQVPNLHEGLEYALGLDIADVSRRGKRLRPALCLMSCEALGGNPKQALPFALAIELMHNFCLIHDDIEDGDRMRRDRPSVWVRYGLAHGINIGDYMLTQVFVALMRLLKVGLPAELTLRLVHLMAETLDHTHIGQAMDINARSATSFSVDDYMKLVTEKTGYYLAAPILAGAMIARATAPVQLALVRFGKCIGPAFQIMDDIIDLTEGKGRKEIGSDIREGKRSFLVAHTIRRCSATERKELLSILNEPRDQTSKEDIAWVIELFERHGAVEAGKRMSQELLRKGKKHLQRVPPRLRRILTATADFLGTRTR
jgi:geranylgeranyl pyrophosphate synthase